MPYQIARLARTGLPLAGIIVALSACSAPDTALTASLFDRPSTNLNLALDTAANWNPQPEEGVEANYDLAGTATYVGGLPVMTRADVTCQGIGEAFFGTRFGNVGSCILVTDDGTYGLDFLVNGTLEDGLTATGTVTDTTGIFEGAVGTVIMQSVPIASTRFGTITMATEIVWARVPGADAETDDT